MSVIIVKAPLKQRRIYGVIANLVNLPKVTIVQTNTSADPGELSDFMIKHEQQFVPDFRFIWCTVKEHYRVYIYVADRDRVKEIAGYTICTVGSGFAAMGFGVLYGFIHKHRANNKEESFLQK
jgi:hypothetical protein